MTSPMTAKTIKSLHEKKYREKTGKFIVEGRKNVLELFASDFKIEQLFCTAEFKKSYGSSIPKYVQAHVVDAGELRAYGTLERNEDALAVVFQKEKQTPRLEGITLCLDDIRDPGNLGTLIRIADWYGIKNIVCSDSSVDWHNPKVINATMGSFTRVNGFYTNLPTFLKEQNIPKFGAFLGGASVHTFSFPTDGILVIGSESHGISSQVEKEITEKITIPSFGKAESLNAAIAGAIILDRWKSSL